MPRTRFGRIREAAQLADAVDRYFTYLRTPRPRRVGNGQSRGPTIRLGVIPFTFDTDQERYATSCTQEARGVLQAAVGVRAATANPSSPPSRLAGWTAARIVLFSGTTGNGVVTTSRITGLPYLKYAGENNSHPFGKSSSTDQEYDAFAAIAAAAAGANRRTSYKPERRYQTG